MLSPYLSLRRHRGHPCSYWVVSFCLFLICILSTALFASQQRLTKIREYGLTSDGAGKIYLYRYESGEHADLWSMNDDGSGQKQLTKDDSIEYGVSVSRDGKKMAYIKNSLVDDEVIISNIDGTSPVKLYSTVDRCSNPVISPDNTKVAFMQTPVTNMYGSVTIVNADGTNSASLAPRRAAQRPSASARRAASYSMLGSTMTQGKVESGDLLAFTADSKKVVFIDHFAQQICSVNTDGTGLQTLYTGAYSAQLLSGDKIALTVGNSGIYDLKVINPDGSDYVTVSTSVPDAYFCVSPDETKYAFSSANNKVITIISNKGAVLNKTGLDGVCSAMRWSSSSKLAFSMDDKDIYILIDAGMKNITNNDLPPRYTIADAKANKVVCYDNQAVYSMDTDGKNKIKLYTLKSYQAMGGAPLTAALSPDGTKLIISLIDATTIFHLFTMKTDGAGYFVDVSTSWLWHMSLQWNPNGNDFKFYDWNLGGYSIVKAAGTGKKTVLLSTNSIDSCQYDSDGSGLLLSGVLDGAYGIWKTPVDISKYTLLLSTAQMAWVMDVKSGVVIFQNSHGDLCSMNHDGTGVKCLVGYTGMVGDMLLSPDGTKLAYTHDPGDGTLFLRTINTNGTGEAKVSSENWPWYIWSSDSKKLLSTHVLHRALHVFVSDPDGSAAYDLNPSLASGLMVGNNQAMYFPAKNTIIYNADNEIWSGDYDPTLNLINDFAIPGKGEVRVLVPEGAGYKGTFNPDKGKPLAIGFKGTSGGTFTLRIFSPLGELVHSESVVANNAEGWSSWIPGNLATGIYYAHVDGPGVKKFKKFAILR